MDRFETRCSGRILTFAVWGLYAFVVTFLWQFVAAHGLPEGFAWMLACGLAFAILLWMREI